MVDRTATSVALGDVIASRYRLESILGAGAMSTVYRARHVKIARPVAIKILHDDFVPSPKLRRRFEREAELAGKLSHPNVVSILDVGESAGAHYIVMDLVDGPTLGSVLEAGAMDRARMIALVRQLCSGLEHAHGHGLVHRDFKPDNIIVEHAHDLERERVRIVDFGISTLRDEATSQGERLTTVGLVLGTPRYMAPEHVTGQAIDHRIDLFALGVVCYEMLTGRAPFDGDGVEVARANLLEEVPAMRDRAPGIAVDPLLEAFTRRLLAKDPDHRPPSAFSAKLLLDLIERDPASAAALLLDLAPPPAIADGSDRLADVIHPSPGPEVAAAVIHLPPDLTPQLHTAMPLPRSLFKRWAPWVAAGALVVSGGIAVARCSTAAAPPSATQPKK
ncbi:MAG: serine/threonine-protein kinase [Kofleriaceae bacterium]